jgi:hypothetical protein
MDEIEFKSAYNDACNATDKISAPETKTAMYLVLQLVNALREQIEELQIEEDDE